MKTTTQMLFKVSALVALGFLASCGTSKATNSTNNGSTTLNSVVEVDPSVPLASCNQVNKASLFKINLANVVSSSGILSDQYIKLKFLSVASSINQSGYNIRLYKWRVINNTTQLDSTPLQVYSYSLDTLQATSTANRGIYTNTINSSTGYMVNLRDDLSNPYQALKVVAYEADGTLIDQADVLIPQFLASPIDYKLNPDRSQRVSLLRSLHPLNSTDVSNWSATKIQDSFDQYCF